MRNHTKAFLKAVSKMAGFDVKDINFRVRLDLSTRRFQRLGHNTIDGYDATRHYGDQLIDSSYRYVQEGFVAARLDFVKRILSSDEIQRSTFADIGDSNGVFLKSLGKRGTSINISRKVLENISEQEVLLAALPKIPLADETFDYLLCFETIEHLHDPIGGLRELARLAKKGIFVSIPYVRTTNFHPYWPDRSRPELEQHVIECSDKDFRKLLTYAGLSVRSMRVHKVFDLPKSPVELVTSLAWRALESDILCGVFRKFSIYYLAPTQNDGQVC